MEGGTERVKSSTYSGRERLSSEFRVSGVGFGHTAQFLPHPSA